MQSKGRLLANVANNRIPTFHGNWNMQKRKRASKTPKQRVIAKYPKAYAVKYERIAFVYEKPATAVPCSKLADVIIIGSDKSVRGAWLDAANRLSTSSKTPNVEANFISRHRQPSRELV